MKNITIALLLLALGNTVYNFGAAAPKTDKLSEYITKLTERFDKEKADRFGNDTPHASELNRIDDAVLEILRGIQLHTR